MIKSWRHKGLRKYYETGDKSGINADFADKLDEQLSTLDAATAMSQMAQPGWDLHPLQGDLKGHWSVKVNGNWRMTFKYEAGDAEVVDLTDYH